MSIDGTWGQFWLPETPDTKIYGLFTVGKDRSIYVHFGGDLTVGFEDVEPSEQFPFGQKPIPEGDGVPEVVHGWLNKSPKAVTLLRCTTTNRNVTRQGLVDGSEQTISPLFGYRGAHLEESSTFSTFFARYEGIDAWADLRLVELDEGTSVSMANLVPTSVVPTALTSGGSVTLTPELLAEADHRGARIRQRVWFTVSESPAYTWREIDRRYLTPTQTLLTLCTGREALVTSVQYATETTYVSALGKGSSNPDSLLAKLRPHQVPLPFCLVGTRGLAAWLDLADTMGPLPPIVAKHVGSNDNGTMESQVIELTSAAEGLHKRLLNPKQVNYRTRVAELAGLAELALPGACGETSAWAELVLRVRNEYVHRQNDFLGPSGEIDVLLVLVKSLRFALRAFLLRYADIADNTIAASISRTSEWQIFREQAVATLPAIFSEQALQ